MTTTVTLTFFGSPAGAGPWQKAPSKAASPTNRCVSTTAPTGVPPRKARCHPSTGVLNFFGLPHPEDGRPVIVHTDLRLGPRQDDLPGTGQLQRPQHRQPLYGQRPRVRAADAEDFNLVRRRHLEYFHFLD